MRYRLYLGKPPSLWMRLRWWLALFCLTLAFAERTQVYNLGRLSATGVSAYAKMQIAANKHTVQNTTSGSPSTCTFRLEGTLDDPDNANATWEDLSGSQDCSVSTAFHVVERPVTSVRVNLLTLSGGTAPTVTIKYVGVQ